MTQTESIINEIWMYSTLHNSTCKVLEEQVLWGKAFERLETTAEDAGHEIFNTLRQDHLQAIEKEKERGKYPWITGEI